MSNPSPPCRALLDISSLSLSYSKQYDQEEKKGTFPLALGNIYPDEKTSLVETFFDSLRHYYY